MNLVKKLLYNKIVPNIGRICLRKNRYCNVIYYHDIVQDEGYSFMRTNINLFKKQMEYLAVNNYETLRFDDFSDDDKLNFMKKRILITFDDGWRSNYTEIFDFLTSLGIKYNIFLTIGEIDTNESYLTWDMIRKMHDSGMCGFGTHTFSHVDIADLREINIDIEVNKSNNIFFQELNYTPVDFCFPYGRYSQGTIIQLIRDSGYKRFYTSNMMYTYLKNGKLIFGRNGISNDESFKIFKNKLNGLYNGFHMISH